MLKFRPILRVSDFFNSLLEERGGGLSKGPMLPIANTSVVSAC